MAGNTRTHRRRSGASTKGTRSKTHPGRKNYTTKKGDKVYHRKGHYVKKSHTPFTFFKGSKSNTLKNLLGLGGKKR